MSSPDGDLGETEHPKSFHVEAAEEAVLEHEGDGVADGVAEGEIETALEQVDETAASAGSPAPAEEEEEDKEGVHTEAQNGSNGEQPEAATGQPLSDDARDQAPAAEDAGSPPPAEDDKGERDSVGAAAGSDYGAGRTPDNASNADTTVAAGTEPASAEAEALEQQRSASPGTKDEVPSVSEPIREEPAPALASSVSTTPRPTPAPPSHATAESHKAVALRHPPSPPQHPRTRQQQQQQQQQQQRPASHSRRSAAQTSRIEMTAPSVSRAVTTAPPFHYDGDSEYEAAEAERIAAAAAALTPNTVLALFRRGRDNSHTNRMEAGSYSRYLLSTDYMPPVVLNETFHGEQPTFGTVPRNTVRITNRFEEEDAEEAQRQQQQQQRPCSRRSASASRRTYYPSSSSVNGGSGDNDTAAPPTDDANGMANSTFGATAASNTLRREMDMLDDRTLTDLADVRQQRRRDPRHGKPATPQLDYVYYNSKSKGFYIPHDPSPDTVMLQYNHLYDFNDGTRFGPLRAMGSASAHPPRHNPHAAPPRTFAETRGEVFHLTVTQRQQQHSSARSRTGSGRHRSSTGGHPHERASPTSSQQHRRQRADIQNGSSSLRTAKAIDLSRLHRTQCPKPRTIEEVLADPQQNYLYGGMSSGRAPHPLVRDVGRDVEDGKLDWTEVPSAMRSALVAASTVAAQRNAAQQQQKHFHRAGSSSSSAAAHKRTGSLAHAANGLVDVMGHVRPTPAIVAAAAAPAAAAASSSSRSHRSPASGRDGGGVSSARTYASSPAAAAASSARLPAISRLHFEQRPNAASNPSAFV